MSAMSFRILQNCENVSVNLHLHELNLFLFNAIIKLNSR